MATLARPLHDRPGRARASTSGGSSCRARTTRAAGRTSSSRSSRSTAATGRPLLVFGGVHGDEPEGQVAALQPRARDRPGGRRRPADRRPVRLARGLARVHAALAVGREPQPLVPRLARRAARRAARRLLHALPDPARRRRRRHAQRRPQRPLPAVVGDALGRRRRAAPPDGRGRCSRGTPTSTSSTSTSPARGLLVGEAERQGKIVVSTELGGGGHVHRGDAPRRARAASRTCCATSACSPARCDARALGLGRR